MNDYTIHPAREKLLRPHKVAEILDISRMSVYRLVDHGDLKGIRTSPRSLRILESSVWEHLKKLNPLEEINQIWPAKEKGGA